MAVVLLAIGGPQWAHAAAAAIPVAAKKPTQAAGNNQEPAAPQAQPMGSKEAPSD